ncbi:MAG TPA: hypothetical protein VF533_18310 [Solirubrobacteraceae bacterium]
MSRRSGTDRQLARRAAIAAGALVVLVAAGLLIFAPGTPGSADEGRQAGGEAGTPSRAQPTRAGAVRAAARFLASLSLEVVLDDARRDRLVSAMAASEARTRLRRVYAAERDRIAADYTGARRVARSAPLGYRVEDYGGGRAAVAIWSVAIGVSDVRAAGVGWSTTTVRVVWQSEAWRVAAVSQVAGPSPATSLDVLDPAAASFKEFRYVP